VTLTAQEEYRNMARLARTAVLVAIVVLAAASGARASEPSDVHFRLQGGVCAIASPRQYNIAAKFSSAPEIISVGASVHPRRFASASFDFSFINLGQGTPSSLVAANSVTTVESSSLVSALFGLEVRRPAPDGRGAYGMIGAGFGRAFLGGVHEGTVENPGRVLYPGTRIAGPVVAAGVGVRSARIFQGPSVQLDMRWVSLLSGDPRVSLVPITLGFVF
jgi:hypothetical protein